MLSCDIGVKNFAFSVTKYYVLSTKPKPILKLLYVATLDLSEVRSCDLISYLVSILEELRCLYPFTTVVIEQQNNKNIVAQKISVAVQAIAHSWHLNVSSITPPTKHFDIESVANTRKVRKDASVVFANNILQHNKFQFTVHDHSDSYLIGVFYLIKKCLKVTKKFLTVDDCRNLIDFRVKSNSI